ncbi:MAG: hypothetical protein M1820_007984 [Bogoriella megaspora]|nr:MAG: hypothetical protein M1820_007984 [Bogoriella megaspora]
MAGKQRVTRQVVHRNDSQDLTGSDFPIQITDHSTLKMNPAVPVARPKAAKKAKGKNAKQASAEPTPDAEEDDSEIRCLCGANEDEGGYRMICCDKCEVWQHNICMGLPEEEDQQPDSYFCEQCKPENHKELLAAMARGEKPWEDRMRASEEEKKKSKRSRGKKGKGGARQSRISQAASEVTEEVPSSTPAAAPQPEDSRKRKFSEVENGQENAEETPEKAIRKDSEVSKRTARIPSRVKDESPTSAQQPMPDVETQLVQDIKQLPKERQAVGEALRKVLVEQIRQHSKHRGYRIPDGDTADSLGNRLAVRTEYALYMNHCNPSSAVTQAYKSQFREINANIKRNAMLLTRLLENSLTPDELATMAPADMATEEKQKEMAEIKKQVDKQATLVQEQKPRVRKTHKGDELIEEEDRPSDSYVPPPPVRRNTEDVVMGEAQHSPTVGGPGGSAPRPTPIDTGAGPRRESSFNMNNVWSSVQSPSTEQPRLLSQPARRRSSGVQKQQSNGTPQAAHPSVEDPDIDRMLRDDEPDNDEPYSPAELIDPHAVWRGNVHLLHIGKFPATATHVAGADLSVFYPYTTLLPKHLDIDGRIGRPAADQYLCDLQHSKTSDVSVLALHPASSSPAFAAEFAKIFNYFSERDRYAVITRFGHEVVKDIYITPVDVGMGSLPPHIPLLEHNIIEQPVPQRTLLLTIVVKAPAPTLTPLGRQSSAPGLAATEGSPVGATPTPQAVSGAPNTTTSSYSSQPPLPGPSQEHLQYTPGDRPYTFTMDCEELAWRVLGRELFDAPVVRQLLGVTPDVTEEQLLNLKEIMQTFPSTRESISELGEVLKERNEGMGRLREEVEKGSVGAGVGGL